MLQSDIDRTVNLLFKQTDLFLRASSTLTDTLYGLVNNLTRDRSNSELLEHIKKGGRCEFITCSKEAAPEIERKLRQNAIEYIKSGLVTSGGNKIFIYADKDAQEVNKIVNEYRCQHNRGGIQAKDVVFIQANGSVQRISSLDKYDCTILAEYAKQQGVSVAIEPGTGKKYSLYYPRADRSVMENAKMTLAIQKTYPKAFEALKKQIDYEESKKRSLIYTVQGKKDNVPFYIGDMKGNYMIASADKVTFHEYGGAESVLDYSDPDRENKIVLYIGMMDNPQELDGEAFEEYQEADFVRKKEIVKDSSSDRPTPTPAEMEEIKKMEAQKELYEWKLAQENPEQIVYAYAYTNNEMRKEEFESLEQINSDAVHDMKELRETNDPILYDDARSIFRGFRDEIIQVDLNQEQFANAIMDGDVEMVEQIDRDFSRDDLAVEVMNDRNENMIPDDRETNA
ncbi:hypothetical protein LKD70_09155 [Ruminococcus sp. CLA-AA-H200]|uniref:Large polyvalent protein-associated domain-containing protein n=1 Tax=Ruminococcus turbiniformis TaxID=2881258 RepID=A0ABS8FXA1_9FIRM|nr:hypothetical protein [Ruminococcus turbiniformis]MCC2254582.1 hypothetical protein [Ruminococcus turbiniformis]